MGNVVVLHGSKRWKAVIEYAGGSGPESAEHYFEEVSDLHLIIEHGKDWNRLVRCVLTLNRSDPGDEQNHMGKAARVERT